ncbi:hypothetical protein DM813_00565 [Pseudomonas alkylphenolica]|uniref:Uncharacterized protein n=1 Tax=Pseudomonas alkylphenolica TaxID=237609 RepID=A0A443ZY32_9PSED|nr:hypothetical protein [Pseudomonas alkylphenolica]RWU26348.1 hypothetical protein DM813_00565 [Pseudomonas alkylphenolica]
MHTKRFSLVLSGNCLLLLSADLDDQQRQDAIDAHLFCWLNASAEFLLLSENQQWHGTYMDRHTGLGWVVSATGERINVETATVPFTPLAIAWHGLGSLPASLLPTLNAALTMIQALPETHPALQALGAEALERTQAPGVKPVTRIALELRVVLPGLKVLASSVFLETHQCLERQWLTQPLEIEEVSRQVTRNFTGELFPDVFAGIRTLLETRLEPLRAMYVMPLNVREDSL